MTTSALLLIDIQNDYFPGGRFPLKSAPAAGNNAARLLADFRTANQPIIHIRHISVHEGATFFLPDTPGQEIHSCVRPAADEPVLIKHRPNSFVGTELEALLHKKTISHLVVAGMMSNMCVDASVRQAVDLGFTCTVVHDACAAASLSFNGEHIPAEQVHGAFMAALGMAYAETNSTKDFLGRVDN